MWIGLDDIAWNQTRHNYGSGTNIPGLLRRCGQPDNMEPLDELENLLYHQGGWVCSAATAALPFLVRLAADPATAHRATVVKIIAGLANEATVVEAKWVDSGWPTAFTNVLAQLAGLVTDPDPAVRRAVARLLADCGGDRDVRLSALRAGLRAETDPGAHADLVLALGELSGDRGELESALTDPDPRVRLAAMVGLMSAGTGSAAEFATPLAMAVNETRHSRWQGAAWVGGQPVSTVGWAGRALLSQPGPATEYAAAVLRGGGDLRSGLRYLTEVVAAWRSSVEELLPLAVEHKIDPDADVRYQVVWLLGALGGEATGFGDLLAELLTDSGRRHGRLPFSVAAAAAWALSRRNDERCVPFLSEQIANGGGCYGSASHYGSGLVGWLPGLHEVVSPLESWVDRLLPVLRTRLAVTRSVPEVRALTGILAEWGELAHPVVPELANLLDHEELRPMAAVALAGIGSAAATVAPELERWLSDDRGSERDLAWAHWRLTGDPRWGLPATLTVLNRPASRSTVARLAEFGELARDAVPRLRELIATDQMWGRAEAAYALWAITGEAEEPVTALTSLVADLDHGRVLPVMLPAIRYLTRIGQAFEAVPIMTAALARNDRLAYFGGWRRFTEDAENRAAATALIAAVR